MSNPEIYTGYESQKAANTARDGFQEDATVASAETKFVDITVSDGEWLPGEVTKREWHVHVTRK